VVLVAQTVIQQERLAHKVAAVEEGAQSLDLLLVELVELVNLFLDL
jgi:hypothetical protein